MSGSSPGFLSNSYSIYLSDSMSFFSKPTSVHSRFGVVFAPKKLSCWSLLRTKIIPKTSLKSTLFFERFLEHFWLHFGSILSSLWPQTRTLGLPIGLPGAPFCSLCPRRALQGPILAHFGSFGLTFRSLLAHFWLILGGAFRHCTTD